MLTRYYLLEGLNALGTNVFFLGVFFHARVNHGFSDGANLMLAAAQGAAYVAASRAGGRHADRVGAERSIALGLAGMCLALLAGWLLPQAAALFATIAAYSAATALTWPALEAAIARAPGPRRDLARRAGLYNVIWSLVGAAGFFFSGPLFALESDIVFLVPLAAHALMLAGIAATFMTASTSPPAGGVRADPCPAEGAHRDECGQQFAEFIEQVEGVARSGGPPAARSGASTDGGAQRQDPEAPGNAPSAAASSAGASMGASPPLARLTPLSPPQGFGLHQTVAPLSRAAYLLSARIANGLGYFLFGAFAALAPTIGERLGLGPRQAIWLVSSYLFARSAVFLLFWRWEGWEYRRGWVGAALAFSPPALAATFLAPSATAAIVALAVLGAMSGVAYSASLHASLDREGSEGEGGGFHEWVIGIGVLLGPLAGAAGSALFTGPVGAGGLVTALGAMAALAGLGPLLKTRDER